MDDAEALHKRAVVAANSGDYSGCLSLTDQARGLTDDLDLLDRLDVTASWAIAETIGPAGAIELCEQVLGREQVQPLTAGLAHSQLGMLHMMNADSPRAFAHFQHSIEELRDHPQHVGKVFINRGMAFLQGGDPDSAVADFTEAADYLERAGEREERAKAIFNLAYSQLQRNDLVAAMRGMDEAAEILAPMSPMNRAIVQQDRAEVLVASGRTREAVEALEAAVAAYGGQKLRRFQAGCELLLARTLLAEQPARARTVARAAARRFRSHGSEPWALRADAVAVMAEIEDGATGRALIAVCDDLAEQLRRGGHRLDADRLALHAARLAVRRGDHASATARAGRVRTTADSPITLQLLAREVRAELAAEQGHLGRSRTHAQRGLAELHTWQATFGSLDLQTSVVGHGQHLARLGLRAAMADGHPEVVFEWSERARALASRVTALRPPPDPALAADLTALRLAAPEDLSTRRELRERIRSHAWIAARGTVGEPADLVALQDRLARDDAALVAHIVLDGTLSALAVTATDAAVIPLGTVGPVQAILDRIAADLDFAANNHRSSLAEVVRASLRTDLAKLADVLVRPALAVIGYRRLVLTPSALLAGTPWTALPGLIGRPVTVPTSATAWLEQTARDLPPVREVGLLAGPRLGRAEEEIRRAGIAWPRAHVLSGNESDSTRAGWLAARVDLLHIAGHGSHPGDHPLFSAVELADGPWFGHDIDLLPRAPDVVVLSACDLGRSSAVHTEESLGMSAVWLHAGSRAVISSLALVADDLACEVFAAWHERVAAGAAPADALAQVIAATDDIVPFLCFGAGW